jgi:hypothetical protein
VLGILEGVGYSIFISVVTLVTLFADDFRLIFFSPSFDDHFSVVAIVCMCVFGFEIIVLSLVMEGYFLRYYFWLDMISTFTMLFDITWFANVIAGVGYQNASKVVKIAKASRTSKIGANSTKLIRILRLIRLLKMHQHASNELKKANDDTFDGEKKDNELKITSVIPFSQENPTTRKMSKRMDRVRQASSNIMNKKREGKHLVSIKDITFEGSQRKLSALHPSQNINKAVLKA